VPVTAAGASRLAGLLLAVGAAAALPAAAAAIEVRAVDASTDAGFVDVGNDRDPPRYDKAHTWSANVADFNGDDVDDVLISIHYQGPSWLMENEVSLAPPDHTLTEILPGTFPDVDRHDCAWGDVNLDDLPDAYCTLGGERGEGVGPNELWIQRREQDGTISFVDRGGAYGVRDRYGRGRYTTFIHANGDDFPDLYVSNSYPRKDGRPSINKLFINEGGEDFRRAPGFGLDRQLGGNSVQAVDYDDDGREDLLVCGKESLHLFRNRPAGGFSDVSSATGAQGPCESALLANLDGDELPDLVRVASDGMVVKLQRDGEFRSPVFERWLQYGRAVAAGDVDADGDSDLYVMRNGPKDEDVPDEHDLMYQTAKDGHDYRRIRIPQTTEGRGDAVSTIDYDDNGLSDFIVLNGHSSTRGPIRMVAFCPTTATLPCPS
jgi:hypothetical protein